MLILLLLLVGIMVLLLLLLLFIVMVGAVVGVRSTLGLNAALLRLAMGTAQVLRRAGSGQIISRVAAVVCVRLRWQRQCRRLVHRSIMQRR